VPLPGFGCGVCLTGGAGRVVAPGGLDAGVLAVGDVDVLGVVAARDAADPGEGDVRAGDGVPPAAAAGTCLIACPSAGVIIHPQVKSTFRRGEHNDSRWAMSSWLASAPSLRLVHADEPVEG